MSEEKQTAPFLDVLGGAFKTNMPFTLGDSSFSDSSVPFWNEGMMQGTGGEVITKPPIYENPVAIGLIVTSIIGLWLLIK